MRIEKISIRNFMSHRETEIELTSPGRAIRIDGEVGAGKSTIYESIFWALFGVTKRGLKSDKVLNKYEKGDCRVEIVFVEAGVRYRVARHRKHSEHGNNLLFGIVGGADLTKGTVAETQALLENTIKRSKETFCLQTSFGQEDISDFAAMSDAELKRVFDEALGYVVLSETQQKIKDKIKNTRAQIAITESERRSIQETVVLTADHIKKMGEAQTRHIEEETRRAEELERKAKESREQALAVAPGFDRESVDKTVSALTKASASVSDKIAEQTKVVNRLTLELSKKGEERAKLLGESGFLKKQILQMKESMQGTAGKIGSPCESCGKLIEAGDVQAVLDASKAKIMAGVDEFKNVSEVASATEKELSILAEECEKEKNKLALLEENKKQIEAAILFEGGKLSQAEKAKTLLDVAERFEAQAKEHRNSKPPFEIEIEAMKRKCALLLADKKNKEAALAESEERLSNLLLLEEIFGNGGIKSYLLDSITPELNRYANEYLEKLNPGNRVEISTISRTAKGDIREKFGIEITSLTGADEYKGCSGGEKTAVNLAISLAFNRICASVSESGVNLLFFDEPLENLNQEMAERAIELIDDIASVTGNVFVISHNPIIKELIPDSVLVSKKDGISSLAA